MGAFEDLGKAALQGLVKGIDNYQKQKSLQQQQSQSQNFGGSGRSMQAAAENGDIDAISDLAVTYFQQGDYQQSAYWARKGATVNDATCLYLLGEIAFAQEDFKAAENFWTRNVNVNGDSLSATCLGNLYLNAEIFDDAQYMFELALRSDNSNSEAALGLALCLINNNSDDVAQVKQLLQLAARSEIYSTRDAANQMLQQMRAAENEARNNQQNNGGCFVTTAVCDSFGKPDDCAELTAFRNFRDGWLVAQPDGKSLIAEYYSVAPKIVEKINRLADAAQIYENIWQKYLAPCLNFIKRGENLACKNKYVEMVRELKSRYL